MLASRIKEIKFICYYSSQNLLPSCLLSKIVKIKIYKSTTLPVVLQCCEMKSVTLKRERRFMVFKNGMLENLFGPKREGVTGDVRKLPNEELS